MFLPTNKILPYCCLVITMLYILTVFTCAYFTLKFSSKFDCGFFFLPPLSSGEAVDRNLCSSSLAPEPVPCEVPCSRDCVLSDWTSWSTCSQTCSSKNIEGKQMRTRSILAYNAGEGESPLAVGLPRRRLWK